MEHFEILGVLTFNVLAIIASHLMQSRKLEHRLTKLETTLDLMLKLFQGWFSDGKKKSPASD